MTTHGSGNPALTLESLLVEILGDATSLVAAGTQVDATVTGINTALSSIQAYAVQAVNSMSFVANGLATLTGVFASTQLAVQSLGASLARAFTSRVNTANLTNLVTTLQGVTINPAIAGGLNQITSAMGSLSSLATGQFGPRMRRLSVVFQSLTTDLTNLVSVNLGNLPQLQAMTTYLSNLGAVSTGPLFSMARAIRNLGLAFSQMASANVGNFLSSGSALLSWVNRFAGINPAALTNLALVGRAINRITSIMPGGGGPGKLPVINNTFSTMMRGTGEAASQASVPIGGFTGRLRDLTRGSQLASGSLTVLRFSLLGLAGFGVASVFKLDQALTRTLMHAGELTAGKRQAVEKQLIGMSSVYGTLELAKALDVLTSAGMGTQTALDALRKTESYATAAGTDVIETTRRLTEIQFGLGMASTDTEKHMLNLNRITDMFAKVAPQAGMSGMQMAEAFGGSFTSSIRRHNIALEDAIGLTATYSRMGYKGSQAGEYAARFIQEVTKSDAENFMMWKQIGIHVFEEGTQKMRPLVDIVSDLSSKFKGMTPFQQAAALSMMHIPNRAEATIRPLMGAGDAMRYFTEMAKQANGEAERQAEIMRSSFSGQLMILWKLVRDVGIELGQRLVPSLNILSRGLGAAFGWFVNLNPAFQNLIVLSATLAFTFRPLLRLFLSLTGMFLGPLISGVRMFYSVIASGVSLLATTTLGLLSTVPTLFALPMQALKFVWHDVIMNMVGVFKFLGGAVASLLTTLSAAAAQGVMGLLSLGAYAVGFGLASIGPILVNLVGFFAMLPMIGGLIATIVIGVMQLGSFLTGSVVALWQQMKSEIPAFFQSVAERLHDFGKQGVVAWMNIKANADVYFQSIIAGLGVVAGFFWNFGQNVIIIFEWLRRNWRTVANDMGQAFVVIVENMVHNIGEFARVLGELISAAWRMAWETAKGYFTAFQMWLSANWSYMLNDLGNLFKGFLRNLTENIILAFKMSFALVKFETTSRSEEAILADLKSAQGNRSGFIKGLSADFYQKELDEYRGGRQKIFSEYFGKMKGPFDNVELPNNYLKTLSAFMEVPSEYVPANWTKMMKGFSTTLGSMEGAFKPLLEGFKPITQEVPKLMLGLPDDAGDQLLKSLKNAFMPSTAAEPTTNVIDKQMPGFQFKQISLERTLLGGPAAESLDYQQLVTLKQIHNTLIGIYNGLGRDSTGEPMQISREVVGE